MRVRDLHLSLEENSKGPLYLRVAEAVVSAIRDGRIHAGMSLPGVRDLAERLGVHHNTVLAALRELEAQGWVEARARSGFFVSDTPPEGPAAEDSPEVPRLSSPGFDVPARLHPITDARNLVMDLSEGVADSRLAPTEAMARAYQRALRLKGPELLRSGDFKGQRRLREALAEHLAQHRSLVVDPDQILLTRGTNMAVSLVAQALIGPEGGAVALENPGNPMVRETFQQASSASLHPLPVDAEGLRLEPLDELMKTTRLQLLVVTPQCHFPTGIPLASDRRTRLLEYARQFRFAILELDAEFDQLPGPEAPPKPLASADTTGQVLYVGSLARILAPGVRLGYLVVPAPLADRLAKVRQRMDWQGDPVLEWSISELLLDGEYLRHLRRVKKASLERREALIDAIVHTLGDRVAFDSRHGAMALWLKGIQKHEDPVRFAAWIRSCGLKGLKLRPGAYYDFEGTPIAATRLGYTAFRPEELQQAVAMMA